MAFLVSMFLLVSGSFADTETLVIEAIIPGGGTSGEIPVHALVVQDLFLQNQNLIANGDTIDVGGQGTDLFGDTPIPLFVVRHVTNSTEPMIISVEVSPFICTNTDGTASVLTTNVQSQAGLDANLSDIQALFVSESRPNDQDQTRWGGADDNPKTPNYSGARMIIMNGDNTLLTSYDTSNIVAKTESLELTESNDQKTDSYKFLFEKSDLIGKWFFDEDEIFGWGTGYGTWKWQTESFEYITNSLIIPNGGFITEYVEYSVNITNENIPTDGKYVMNVKVSLSTDQ